MIKSWTAHHAHALDLHTARTLLTWFQLGGAGWFKVRRALLAFAAGSLLIACGGGGGGGASGTVPVPVPPKALEILSVVVSKDEVEVDASQPVDPRVTFRFAFNANLSASGISADQVRLSDGTRTYPVNIVLAGTTLTVKPIGNLHTSLYYTLTVKAGASGGEGSVLKNDYVFNFRTVVAVFEAKQLTQPAAYVGGGPQTRILITEMNGDGRPDLVKLGRPYTDDGRTNGYTLSIFVQNAAGGFENFQQLEHIVNRSTYSARFDGLVVQDIDGDNQPELLVPEFPSDLEIAAVAGIRIFKAGADGKYGASGFIETPYVQSLQAMDVDGDGLTDLVGHRGETSYDRTSAFQVLQKTSSGLVKLAPVVLPSGDYEFGVSDLDLDGRRELIVNRIYYGDGPTKSELLIYSQSAPATFSPNTALTTKAVGFCASADVCNKMNVVDVNGDGKAELVFSGRRDAVGLNDVITFSHPATGGLTKLSQVTLNYGNFYGHVFGIHDLDGDAVPDLLAVAAGYFGILEGGSNFSWLFSNQIKTPVLDTVYPSNVAIADIDGDGLPDVIFDSANSGIVMARQINFRRVP